MLLTALCLCAFQDPASRPDSIPSLGYVQLANGFAHKVLALPSAKEVAVVLAVGCGYEHDPERATGLARALATMLRLQETGDDRLQVRTVGRATLLGGVFAPERLPEKLARFATLLTGRLPAAEEAAVVAIARARLEADDDTEIVPGPVLEMRARRVLLAGTPGGRQVLGVPAQMNFTPEQLAARFAAAWRPDNAHLVVLGAVDEGRVREAIAKHFGPLERGGAPPARCVHDPLPPPPEEAPLARLDAPFVSAGLVGPRCGEPDWLPFLIAAEVLRVRALQAFREPRGGELQARFAPLAFDYWDGGTLVLVNRRGRNGDAAAEPRSEIRALLARFHGEGPRPEELAQATLSVARALWLPPYGDAEPLLAKEPRLLLGRAVTLAMARVEGWPADTNHLTGRIRAPEVMDVIARRFQPAAWRWFVLLPQ